MVSSLDDFGEWEAALECSSGETHPQFDVPDGDVVLISTDKVKFKTYRQPLVTTSAVLGELVCSVEDGAEVAVEEPSGVLEVILKFCRPGETPPFQGWDNFWGTVAAFGKYRIERGIDHVNATYRAQLPTQPKNAALMAEYYLFCFHYNPDNLDHATTHIINSRLPWGVLAPVFKNLERLVPNDGGRLATLLLTRLTILHEARSIKLNQLIGAHLFDAFAGGPVNARDLAWGLEMWGLAAFATTPASLEEYRRRFVPTVRDAARRKVWDALPWQELKEVLVGLPTKLE